MFIGRYPRAIDNKGRIAIPVRLRHDLKGEMVVTRGLDGCLWLFPTAEWERFAEHIGELPLTNPTARAFTRFMFANACACKPDKQGRILIPKYLLEAADIGDEAVVIGSNSRLEIWEPTRLEEVQSRVEADPELVIAEFAALDI